MGYMLHLSEDRVCGYIHDEGSLTAKCHTLGTLHGFVSGSEIVPFFPFILAVYSSAPCFSHVFVKNKY